MTFPVPPSFDTPIPNEPFYYFEEKGGSPKTVEEYLQGVFTKGFALDELLENKHIEVRFSDAKETEAADEDFYTQPYEQGKLYQLGDNASLATDDDDNYVQWRNFSDVYSEDGMESFNVYAVPSVTIQPDRALDWARGVQDGYIDINSNYVLKYAGKVGEFQPNTPYRFLDKITVPYSFDHGFIGDTAEETLTLARCIQDYEGGEEFDSDFFEIYNGDGTNTAEVVPWNEEENKATLHIYDPATIMDRTGGELEDMASDTRHFFVMKQINGQNTLWYSRWHRQATAPAGTSEFQDTASSYLVFDGNLLWTRDYWDYSRSYTVYPPYDARVEDGATINVSTVFTGRGVSLNVKRLGGANFGSEGVGEIGIGAGSGAQGIKLVWQRAVGVWTFENT